MGSLVYGVYELEIPLLLGHKGCGAVKATMETLESGGKAEGSIAYLVEAIRPAVETSKTEVLGLVLTETDAVEVPKDAMLGDAAAPKTSAHPPKAGAMSPSLPVETPAVDATAPAKQTAAAEPPLLSQAVAEPASSAPAAPETVAAEEVATEKAAADETSAQEPAAEETVAEGGCGRRDCG